MGFTVPKTTSRILPANSNKMVIDKGIRLVCPYSGTWYPFKSRQRKLNEIFF